MDNILLTKEWIDDDLVELKVEASSKFVKAFQYCYMDIKNINAIGQALSQYAGSLIEQSYFEFGVKNGNSTPAFSLNLIPVDKLGHIQVEIDLEIDDNNDRIHRCVFYVNTELGCINNWGKAITALSSGVLGMQCTLNPE